MLKITVMPTDGRSYTQHFYSIEKAKSFLDRLVEQSGGAAQRGEQSARGFPICTCKFPQPANDRMGEYCRLCGKAISR